MSIRYIQKFFFFCGTHGVNLGKWMWPGQALRALSPRRSCSFYTPRQRCNSFDISCECVSLLPLSWTNWQTYGHEFQHLGQVEEYLGQVQRSESKVKVTRSRNSRLWEICRGLIFRVSLTPLGSNFYYDNAFIYRVYWTVLKVLRKIFGPRIGCIFWCRK